jgi:hypothetical protein
MNVIKQTKKSAADEARKIAKQIRQEPFELAKKAAPPHIIEGAKKKDTPKLHAMPETAEERGKSAEETIQEQIDEEALNAKTKKRLEELEDEIKKIRQEREAQLEQWKKEQEAQMKPPETEESKQPVVMPTSKKKKGFMGPAQKKQRKAEARMGKN